MVRNILKEVLKNCRKTKFKFNVYSSKVKVFKLNCSGVLEVISSSGWRHLGFTPDEEKVIIQIDRTKRAGKERLCSLRGNFGHDCNSDCTHHHADGEGEGDENSQRKNTMYMVAYIMLNEPVGSKYYLPEQFTISPRNILTHTDYSCAEHSSSRDAYDHLHGNSS